VLGEIFKNAREAKGVTPSQAAADTRMKMQHVEALESEDFSTVAAPAYAKGFIRLYADYLELDPEPLLAEYVEQFMPQVRQPLLPGEDESGMGGHGGEDGNGFSLSRLSEIEWPFTFSKQLVGIVLGGIAVLVLLVMLLSVLARSRGESAEEVAAEMPQVEEVATSSSSPVLIQGPPEPFIDLYEQR